MNTFLLLEELTLLQTNKTLSVSVIGYKYIPKLMCVYSENY